MTLASSFVSDLHTGGHRYPQTTETYQEEGGIWPLWANWVSATYWPEWHSTWWPRWQRVPSVQERTSASQWRRMEQDDSCREDTLGLLQLATVSHLVLLLVWPITSLRPITSFRDDGSKAVFTDCRPVWDVDCWCGHCFSSVQFSSEIFRVA